MMDLVAECSPGSSGLTLARTLRHSWRRGWLGDVEDILLRPDFDPNFHSRRLHSAIFEAALRALGLASRPCLAGSATNTACAGEHARDHRQPSASIGELGDGLSPMGQNSDGRHGVSNPGQTWGST